MSHLSLLLLITSVQDHDDSLEKSSYNFEEFIASYHKDIEKQQ